MAEIVQLDLQIISDRALKALRSAEDSARGLDKTLDSVAKKAQTLDGIKVSFQIDTSALDKATGDLASLSGLSAKVDIVADGGELPEILSDIRTIDGSTPLVEIFADDGDLKDAKSKVDTLDSETASIDISASTDDLEHAQRLADGLSSESVSVDVNANTEDAEQDLEDIKDKLDEIKTLAVIDLVLNAGDAFDKVKRLVNAIPGVGAAMDMSAAVRQFEAQTGQSGAAIDTVIQDVFVQGFGETRTEVSGVIATLAQAQVPFEELGSSAQSAFEVAKVTGFEVNEVIRAQGNLVRSGLASDYKEAGDIIVQTFQNGGNAADDLLDTINEYSVQFAEIGLNGAQSMELINQALSVGIYNTDKFADSLKEMNIIIRDAVAGENTGAADALQRLGLGDEAAAFQAGDITGAAFAEAAISAIETKGQEADYVLLFGTPIEDAGIEAFKQIDFSAVDNATLQDGVANQASEGLKTNLTDAIEELKRTVEVELGESFEVAGLSLTDAIDLASQKVKEFADLIQSGVGIPEALEIVLQAPGLSDNIHRLEGTIGGFAIEMELFLAGILDALGKGDAATSLREDAASRASTQVAFDLQYAETETEVAAAIKRGVQRGASEADISASINNQINDMIAGGDVTGAEQLLSKVQQDFASTTVTLRMGLESTTYETDPSLSNEEIQKQIDAEFGNWIIKPEVEIQRGDVNLDLSGSQQAIDQAKAELQAQIDTQAALTIPVAPMTEAGESPYASTKTTSVTPYQPTGVEDGFVSAIETGGVDSLVQATEATGRLTEATNDFNTSSSDAAESVSTLASNTGEVTTSATETAGAIDGVTDSTTTLATDGVSNFSLFAGAGSNAAAILIAQFQAVAQTINQAAAAANAIADGDYSSLSTADAQSAQLDADSNKASGGTVPLGSGAIVGEDGRELIFAGTSDLQVLNNQTTEAILEGLAAVLSSGGASQPQGTVVNNTFNISNTLNAASQAQAIGAGDRMVKGLRGF